MKDMDEYTLMETGLKKHGREWERMTGPKEWGISDQLASTYTHRGQGHHSRFHVNWRHQHNPEYKPPGLLELSRRGAGGQEQGGADTDKEFDEVIDYGSRRDRLRKITQLAEEIIRCQKEDIIAARRQDRSGTEGDGLPPGPFAQPRLNRLEWSKFRQLADVEEKDAFAVDVLMGEPNFDDELGFSDLRRGLNITPDSKAFASTLPGQPQLPERVRIHSEALTQILGTILGKEMGGTTVVFVRPFKVLVYCEQALRDWCRALEKNRPRRPKEKGSTATGKDNDNQIEDNSDDVAKSPTTLEHLKCLLSFVDSDIWAKEAYLGSPDYRKVFFSDLWHLFRPGMEVTGGDGKQAYRVIQVNSAKHSRAPPFSITCVYIDFDGTDLGPVSKVFDFKRFDGERDVTSLEVYPLRFHLSKRSDFSDSEWKELEALPANKRYREKLIRRGAKFLQVAGTKHMYYAGPTLESRDEVESQVVIDFESAFSVQDVAQKQWKPELKSMIGNPEAEDGDQDEQDEPCRGACCEMDNVHNDSYVDEKQREEYINTLLPEVGAVNEQPSTAIIPWPVRELQTISGRNLVLDEELLIMSYRVFGFVLRSRKWAKLDLSYLTNVYLPPVEGIKDQQDGTEQKKSTTAFDRLVLEEWHRPMILALIAQHFRDKKSTVGQRDEFDIVKGKGKGLILLLHGAPGVGKTSTAEGVAELFKKPLFQITCGDLGTTEEEVEKALETNFALASRWDCILLLDEADVFLAARTKLDFKRNALVAVFLRVMEYYTGILFLTTNRIGDFDEAFTSRIHISLYYPELDHDKTVRVFQLNMHMIQERFARKGRKIVIDEMGIGGFASQHFTAHPHARWNGRQIRNACQTALALAEFEAQGNSHQDILRPDTVVTLGVKQFEIVRNAYLEFSKYMNDLYDSSPAHRAKDAKVRAIWVDENNNVVADPGAGGLRSMAMDNRAFGAAAKVRSRLAKEQHYGYQDVAAPHPSYTDASRMPPAQAEQFPPGGQSWDKLGMRAVSDNPNPNAPYQGSWEGRNDLALRQPPPGFDQGIQEMYTASGSQAAGQLSPGNLPAGSGNAYGPGAAAPGQQWRGTPGPRQ
ncbi:hypothetical protein B0I35DRAFT_397843 [Stachybotrys elegans]|uniref:AAA+ ATPase domain-containing protein n=1 Tax=Stachybotrys elegans TaxID=80388 RepID=A0A8K0SJE0_9HYPO|nr:hypothetical protein B0I35DRAFT_397843 [Stachybotrys elegans]